MTKFRDGARGYPKGCAVHPITHVATSYFALQKYSFPSYLSHRLGHVIVASLLKRPETGRTAVTVRGLRELRLNRNCGGKVLTTGSIRLGACCNTDLGNYNGGPCFFFFFLFQCI